MMLPNWVEDPLEADEAGSSASERYEPSNAWIDASKFACENSGTVSARALIIPIFGHRSSPTA